MDPIHTHTSLVIAHILGGRGGPCCAIGTKTNMEQVSPWQRTEALLKLLCFAYSICLTEGRQCPLISLWFPL